MRKLAAMAARTNLLKAILVACMASDFEQLSLQAESVRSISKGQACSF